VLSKHPLEVPAKKLSKDEVADALRLSIIAELDAVSLYLQLARSIEDEGYRKVFEDVAKEEKTHVGEFLALLKKLDPEQAAELEAGAREVEELLGSGGARAASSGNEGESEEWEAEELAESALSELRDFVKRVADSARVYRKFFPVSLVGPGVDAVPVEEAGRRRVELLEELKAKFLVSQRALEHAKRSGEKLEPASAAQAAMELASKENELIQRRLLETPGAVEARMGSWDSEGEAVRDVFAAASKLLAAGMGPPYVLFVSPLRFAKLLVVRAATGLTDLERLKAFVKDVVIAPTLPEDAAILVAASSHVLDVVVGVDTEVDYVGYEDGQHAFLARETVALRVKVPSGIAVLKQV